MLQYLDPRSLASWLIVGLIGVSVLTACGARRSSPTTAPQPAAPQATAAPRATSVPLATATPSAAPPAMAIPATQVATTTPPTATPAHTPVPAATATAQPDNSDAALDQLLQKLEQANSAGDSLSDVPELK